MQHYTRHSVIESCFDCIEHTWFNKSIHFGLKKVMIHFADHYPIDEHERHEKLYHWACSKVLQLPAPPTP